MATAKEKELAPWMDTVESLVGVKEISGSAHNPVIVDMFRRAGFPEITDDETAWCAAMANAVVVKHGFRGTRSLLARSFLDWVESAPTTTPRYGDLVIFRRNNSSWQGHVAFFEKWDNNWVYVIGGNQSNAVTRARYPRNSDLLGFRRPLQNLIVEDVPEPDKKVNIKEVLTPKTVGAGGALTSLAAWFMSPDNVLVGSLIVAVAVFVLVVWLNKK